jgi:hypothetical protein
MRWRNGVFLVSFPVLLAALVGCNSAVGPDKEQSMQEQAALEATAIIQRAEATALVMQAQLKATALIQNAGAPPATATATTVARVTEASRAPTPSSVASLATPDMTATDNASLSRVELLRVDFAAEGKYIYVEFRAPPRVARKWRQGNVSVIDEATGTIYNGIPVAPIIGPLIAQPVHEGQIGYVMLTNDGLGIKSGSVVTVVLGDFKQEHVTVK